MGYLDSSGAPKAGYCICVPNPDTGVSVYSCASTADWPPQAHADVDFEHR